MSGLIQEGDWVVVVFKDNKMRLVQVGGNRELKVNMARCTTAGLVGLPYGVELDALPCEEADEEGRKRNTKLHKSMEDALALAIKKGKKAPEGHSKVCYAKLTVVDTRAEQAAEDTRLFEQHRTELEIELNGMNSLLNARRANEESATETNADAAAVSQTTDTETKADVAVAASTMAITADNRNLTDEGGHKNNAQILTDAEIAELRKAGGHNSIVQALVENSKTFKNKTEYSKDKYVIKKKNKYSARIRVMQATAASIANVTWEKTMPIGTKLQGVRAVDSFGHILSFAHVFAGANVMVVETISGLMVGAVAERLAGHGSLVAPYFGQQSNFTAVDYFNLKKNETDIIKPISVIPLLQEHEQQEDEEEGVENKDKTSTTAASVTSSESADVVMTSSVDNVALNSLDSLIIVTKYDPTSTLMPLLKYLAPSRPFVVFSEYLEPLAHCRNAVGNADIACDLRMHETLTREYQVLPYRTHPVMRSSAGSGYMLYGYKTVDGKVPDDFVERRSNKRARK